MSPHCEKWTGEKLVSIATYDFSQRHLVCSCQFFKLKNFFSWKLFYTKLQDINFFVLYSDNSVHFITVQLIIGVVTKKQQNLNINSNENIATYEIICVPQSQKPDENCWFNSTLAILHSFCLERELSTRLWPFS